MGVMQSLSLGLWCQLCWLVLFSSVLHVAAKVMELDGSSNSSLTQNDQSDQGDDTEMDCIDWEGKPVADGETYIPYGSDLCMQCVCENRFPVVCKSVACSAPQDCPNAVLVAGKCCEYKCLTGDSNGHGNSTNPGKDPYAPESLTAFGLRILACAVTSLLVVALIFFIVYRVRRYHFLAGRRAEARSRNSLNEDTDSENYIPQTFMSVECPPYTDPPPPYSPPKPPHIYLGEQPPPYDEISLAENSDGGEAQRTHQPRQSSTGSEMTAVPASRSQGLPIQIQRNVESLRLSSEAQGVGSSRSQMETLPAYASTDVVQGLDSMLAARVAALNGNANAIHADDGSDGHLEHQNSFYGRNGIVGASSSRREYSVSCPDERINMPPVTAFQRFSSLFKRNAPKFRSRSSQARPLSDCHPPPQYTTLPRNNHGSNLSSTTTGRRGQSSSRSVSCSLTNRMCFSYDSARAAYELAAMSPSTSSNSSSSGGGLVPSSPRGGEGNQRNPLHSQQFQDDLRRHLPPLQTSDSSECLAQSSPGTSLSILSPSISSINQTLGHQSRSRDGHEHQASSGRSRGSSESQAYTGSSNETDTSVSIVYDLTGSLQRISSPPSSRFHVQEQISERPEESQLNSRPLLPSSNIHKASLPSNSSPLLSGSQPPQRQDSSLSRSSVINSRTFKKNPSPPLQGGTMTRSQSGASGFSVSSVCSETGEKKLKDGEDPVDSKVLPSDCPYPSHHSLSRTKAGGSSLSSEGSHMKKASPPRHAGALDRVSKNNDSVNVGVCSRSEIDEASLDPATLQVSASLNLCDDTRTAVDRVALPEEIQSRAESQVACLPENVGNEISDKRASDSQSPVISKALGTCSTSPFVTSQSGQLIPVPYRKPSKHHASLELKAKPAAEVRNPHLEGRKMKKKRSGKEKNHIQFSSQHRSTNQKSKHPIRPSHDSGSSHPRKSDTVPCQDTLSGTNSKPRSVRDGDRKKRALSSLSPPLENRDFPSADWLARSCDYCQDANLMGYGNADVYRSYCCEVTAAACVVPDEYLSTQGQVGARLALETSQEKPEFPTAHTHPSTLDRSVCHPKLGHVNNSSQPPCTKKKPSHKRQASAGEKIPNNIHPLHLRPRPKSLGGPLDRAHSRRGDPESLNSVEHGHSVGRGAKSGCGHDLNLDDQMGMIDFFNQGVDYSATKRPSRASFSNDSSAPSLSNNRSHLRAVPESANQHQHGNSRSGLSSDLSFINGSCPTAERGKKRASLPSLPIFTGHSQGVISLGAKNLPSGKMDEKEEAPRTSLAKGSQPQATQATSYV